MQETSALYKELYALHLTGGAWYETVVYIGTGNGFDRYATDRLISVKTTRDLFSGSGPGIGGTAAATIEVTVRNPGTIKRRAEIQPFVRLTDGTRNSEWLLTGVFYTDTREIDRETGNVTLKGFDPMLMMERYLYKCLPEGFEEDENFSWNAADIMQYIADYIGVSLDTTGIASVDVYDPRAEGYQNTEWYGLPMRKIKLLSMRMMASYIAAASGGNWTILFVDGGTLVDSATLTLIPLSMSSGGATAGVLGNENGYAIEITSGVLLSVGTASGQYDPTVGNYHDLGKSVGTMNTGVNLPQWTGVTLTYSGMDDVVAGTGDGDVIKAECPFATQEIADAVLNNLRGQIYQPFEASFALIGHDAYLGDVVNIDGVESILATMDTDYGELAPANISAPSKTGADHEYGGGDSLDFDVTSDNYVDPKQTAMQSDIDNTLNSRIVDEVPIGGEYDNTLWIVPSETEPFVADELWYGGYKIEGGGGDGWVHQIDGVASNTGTINFITSMES